VYSKITVDFSLSTDIIDDNFYDVSTDSLVFIGGYAVNEYIGLEGRCYWKVTSMAVDYYVVDTPYIETIKQKVLLSI